MLKHHILKHLKAKYPNRPSWYLDRLAMHYVLKCDQVMDDRDYERWSARKLDCDDWVYLRFKLDVMNKRRENNESKQIYRNA